MSRRKLLQSGLAVSAASLLPAACPETAPPAMHTYGHIAGPPIIPQTTGREHLLMDFDWKFALGNANDPKLDFGYGALGRERTFAKSGRIEQATEGFHDEDWRSVDLPHDWAIELPFIPTGALPEQGGHPLGREFPDTSIGWYRKKFSLTKDDMQKRIQLEFDGIFRGADVFLNGHYLTSNFSGYSPFVLDVSDWINFDSPNILAIRVDATLGEGWFYEGAGIYRHVWLIKSSLVHLVEWGTWVRAELSGSTAEIKLGSEVTNFSDRPRTIHVVWHLLDTGGTIVAAGQSEEVVLPVWKTHTFEGLTHLPNPNLWSIEKPQLYRAAATVYEAEEALDSNLVEFGVRSIHFDARKGFFLNGKQVKIKGVCCHQDHAGVGTALPDRVQAFRIELLKSMGANGLRTSHNPPTPELIDATDALGMVVMCETRMMDSTPEGLSQLERMIRRFRNHPSIVIWSLGNEEPEQGTSRGQHIVSTMQQLAHQLDPTRLCTVAMNGSFGSGVSNIIDVQGFNYNLEHIDDFHKKFPQVPIIGTETASTVSTRGIYKNDKESGYVSAYDVNFPHWASTAQEWWKFYDEREFLAGGFVWTGFDYRGEPTPYSWPCVSSHFGVLDSCGFPKDNYYYYKAWWGTEDVLHLFPHWNWPADMYGNKVSVWCHTNLDSVELLLNGVSQGEQKVTHNTHVEWKVKYQPGSMEARGSKNGKVVMTARRETTGKPAKVVLHPDRSTIDADGQDVSMIAIEIQDAAGRTMPIASNEISLQVTGPGKLIGFGNGDPSSHESDKASTRNAFNGWAQAIVQSCKKAGTIEVKASSAGLEPCSLELHSKAIPLRPSI